jgi:hypothetical protein
LGRAIVNLSHQEVARGISVHSLYVGRDINVDNVSICEFARIRDSVTNNFVGRGTQRLRKPPVVERRGIGASLDHKFMPKTVEFIVGNSRSNMASHFDESLSGNSTRYSHGLNLICGADGPASAS